MLKNWVVKNINQNNDSSKLKKNKKLPAHFGFYTVLDVEI
jgi:hypothetical protein